jgi:uncharacterized RDD family membrane protein YckC
MELKNNRNSNYPNNATIANKNTRIANFLIDTLVIGFIIQLIWVPLFYDFKLHNYLIDSFYKKVFSVLISFIYYLTTETIWGKTIGKMITKSQVRNIDFTVAKFYQILIRTFLRMIPFDPLSFLGLGKKGWHDVFSKTVVIKTI